MPEYEETCDEIQMADIELSSAGTGEEEISLGDEPPEMPPPSRSTAKALLCIGTALCFISIIVVVAVGLSQRDSSSTSKNAIQHVEEILSFGERSAGDDNAPHVKTQEYIVRQLTEAGSWLSEVRSQTFHENTPLGPKMFKNLYATSTLAPHEDSSPCHLVIATHYDSYYRPNITETPGASSATGLGLILSTIHSVTSSLNPENYHCNVTVLFLDGSQGFVDNDPGAYGSTRFASEWAKGSLPYLEGVSTVTDFILLGTLGPKDTVVPRFGTKTDKLFNKLAKCELDTTFSSSSSSSVFSSNLNTQSDGEAAPFVDAGVSNILRVASDPLPVTYHTNSDTLESLDKNVMAMLDECVANLVKDIVFKPLKPVSVEMTEEILSFGPRLVDDTSSGYFKAILYIEDAFKNLHSFEPISRHTFTQDTVKGKKTFRNLYTRHKKAVLKSAVCHTVLTVHYDSMQHDSLPNFVGATDSATGVALVINMAKAIHKLTEFGCSVSIIFFDGEESFVSWTDTDSVYGSRRFASDWEQNKIPGWEPPYSMESVSTFTLLDLLGTSDCKVPIFTAFLDTTRQYQSLRYYEDQYNKVFKKKGMIFTGVRSSAHISDDHKPFLKATCQEKCMPILHLIANPFPRGVWHTALDVFASVDWAVMAKLDWVFQQWITDVAGPQNPVPPPSVMITQEIISFGTRRTDDSSSGYFRVIKYLKESVSQLENFEPLREHTFTMNTVVGKKTFRNLYTRLIPGVSYSSSCHVVLTAHYDTLQKSTIPKFVGATDSATGIALILSVAKVVGGFKNAKCAVSLVFFDGEEAFKTWSATDSLYGSTRFAEDWKLGKIDGWGIDYSLDSVKVFALLDLLGTMDCVIPDFFPGDTGKEYARLSQIEQSIRVGSMNRKLLQRPPPDVIFSNPVVHGAIDDDHAPFKRLGVPILHLIASPFPSVWHNSGDTLDAVDWNTMSKLETILSIWIEEKLS
eukprot:TRINITY_DN1759_c2_g1_i1.p1 TRINITY_DN1759_c2_g1~~TRINITY_DN1759_c2_g1_i1.p1  ORF type:complete len:968 (+),score=94.89 TRINITY_DN1759_c2_g1_i1:72-2975(+)